MKLATVDDVLERMKLTSMSGTTDTKSIESVLESATIIIESIIRTPVELTNRIDYFDNIRGTYDAYTPQTLFLTQRYVDSSTVEVYNTPSNGENLNDIAGLTALDPLYYYVDKTRGSIRILADLNTAYAGIAVKYTAGYREGTASIPEWLKEAAISAAIYVQHTQAISHGKKDVDKMAKPMAGILYTGLNEHIYTPYDGLYPIRADIV